jgi:hypothetical protein
VGRRRARAGPPSLRSSWGSGSAPGTAEHQPLPMCSTERTCRARLPFRPRPRATPASPRAHQPRAPDISQMTPEAARRATVRPDHDRARGRAA